MTECNIQQIIPGVAASDGDGVKLRRSLGQHQSIRVDPFLMLDEFFSDDAADYIGGFPPHPHRGFETVTYMLEGRLLHEDNFGNRGELSDGGVQWMTAGRGIIHSEMPQQTKGRMRGFQLWINLPAAEKMQPASYRDIAASEIPVVAMADGVEARVISGDIELAGQRVQGPANSPSTQPIYIDLRLPHNGTASLPIPTRHSGFVYVYEGEVSIAGQTLGAHHAGELSAGEAVTIEAGEQGARLLLLAGKPIGEPIEQYGPFVMNTPEEIQQALADYSAGTLAV